MPDTIQDALKALYCSFGGNAGDNIVSVSSNVDPVTLSVEYTAEAS